MKNIQNQFNLSKKRIIKSIFGLFSLSTMLFVFQACYGTPQDFGQDILLEGKVLSASSQEAIEGVEVRIHDLPQYTTTDAEGHFSIFCPRLDLYKMQFKDVDGEANGQFSDLDSTISIQAIEMSSQMLNILLQKK